MFLCLGKTKVFLVQNVEWIRCFEGGKKIPQAQFLWLAIWQVVVKGNLLAWGNLPLDVSSWIITFFQDFHA